MVINIFTEENCKQAVYEYSKQNYLQEFTNVAELFPYTNEGLSADLKFKNMLDWFIFEWINPVTGKTIVREFVEKHQIQEPLREKMLQMETPFYSEFRVLSLNKDSNNLIVLDRKSGKNYEVTGANLVDTFNAGQVIKGRMHAWGNEWRFTGILSSTPSEEEIEMEMFARHGIISPNILVQHFEDNKIEEIEDVIVKGQINVHGILNKYPAHWIDGICDNLKINTKGILKKEKIKLITHTINQDAQIILTTLSNEEKNCLKLIANAGGMIKYGKLNKFSSDMPYWWHEQGVNSTIGKLRAKGLLYVGKSLVGSKFYKMALIPLEVVSVIQGKQKFSNEVNIF